MKPATCTLETQGTHALTASIEDGMLIIRHDGQIHFVLEATPTAELHDFLNANLVTFQ